MSLTDDDRNLEQQVATKLNWSVHKIARSRRIDMIRALEESIDSNDDRDDNKTQQPQQHLQTLSTSSSSSQITRIKHVPRPTTSNNMAVVADPVEFPTNQMPPPSTKTVVADDKILSLSFLKQQRKLNSCEQRPLLTPHPSKNERPQSTAHPHSQPVQSYGYTQLENIMLKATTERASSSDDAFTQRISVLASSLSKTHENLRQKDLFSNREKDNLSVSEQLLLNKSIENDVARLDKAKNELVSARALCESSVLRKQQLLSLTSNAEEDCNDANEERRLVQQSIDTLQQCILIINEHCL